MKFTVDAKKFKRLTEGAISVASATDFNDLKYIEFNWEDANQIRILSANLTEYYDGILSFSLFDVDKTYINRVSFPYAILKKVYNMTSGEITITIEDDYSLTLSNGKKSLKIQGKAVDDDTEISRKLLLDKPMKKCFEIDTEELSDTLTKLDAFRSRSGAKPILTGFNLDCSEKWLSAIDGYHMGIRKFKIPFEDKESKFTFYGGVTNYIRKYFIKNDTTTILYNGKYVMFKSDELTYSCRILEGAFHPVKQAIPTSYQNIFSFDVDNVLAVCKDYNKYISVTAPAPIILCKKANDDKFYVGLKTSDIKVCTGIEGSADNTTPEILMGFDNRYTWDCFEIFKGKRITVKYNKELHPLLLEDDDYLSVLLPVRLPQGTTTEEYIGMIKSA